jgi:hypothetical protein
MPSNKIAGPSFVTGPNDKLLTVDVFTGSASGIVNSIESLAAKYDVDLIGMLRAGAAAAKLLPVVEGLVNGKLLLNPQAAIARLLTASNTLVGAVGGSSLNSVFNTLSSGVQAGISEAGQVLGSVEATVGGVVSTIANGAISDIQSLGGLINGFANSSGAFMMIDTQALAGMAAGVINQCAQYGISGAFQQMVSNITNPRVLNSIIAQTLPNLVGASDINGLQALANVANVVGITAVNPQMLSSFTTGYSRSASGSYQQSSPNQDATTWTQISDCYGTADPTWDSYQRTGDASGDPSIDLTSLQGGTDDFNSTLAAGVFSAAPADTTTPLYALATVYPAQPVDTQLKSMYPNTYIDPALRSTPLPVEPTQLSVDTQTVVSAATSTTAVQIAPSSGSSANQYGTITSAQAAAQSAAGYNSGAIVFDNDTPVATPAATPVTPKVNDQVGSQPNPATYQTIDGALYSVTPGNGEAWSSTAINWGGGVAHGDGQYNYTPVNPGG